MAREKSLLPDRKHFPRRLAPESLSRGEWRRITAGMWRSKEHIVYALHSEQSFQIDFTCCDAEAAVLARNVLLFTLIIDKGDQKFDQNIWNIFYHLYLDAPSYDLLISQCHKLVSLSTSLDCWKSAQYAPFLRFCSDDSLQSIRKMWLLSAEHVSLAQVAKDRISDVVRRGVDNILHTVSINDMATARSAGPVFFEALLLLDNSWGRFWRTGTVSDTEARSDVLVNPTLYYTSTSRFDLHYGTNPLAAFHLAPAAAYIKTQGQKKTRSSKTIRSVVADVKEQFRTWCSAVRSMLVRPVNTHVVVIRIFCGDALAFAAVLRDLSEGCSSTAPFLHPLSTKPLVLDDSDYSRSPNRPSAPSMFNVVDTSNLADPLGLLNIVAVTIPLMSAVETATLYTETLIATGARNVMKGFLENLCVDPTLFQLLLGVAPITSAYHHMSQSSAHEWSKNLIAHDELDQLETQYHERMSWKNLWSIERHAVVAADVALAPSQLAQLLFNFYLTFFSQEDLDAQRAKLSIRSTRSLNIVHNVRGCFAALLAIARKRLVSHNWEDIIGRFTTLIQHDRKLCTGPNFYQDLCCQLYLYGVFDAKKLFPAGWDTSCYSKGPHARFRLWSHLPTVVQVLLVVPHSRVNLARNTLTENCPVLQAQVGSTDGSDSSFGSVKIVFGRVSASLTGDGPITIEEDLLGLDGSAPMLVSFYMPGHMLLRSSPCVETFRVSFRSSPGTVALLAPKFGLGLQLFSASIADETKVYFSQELPHYYRAPPSTPLPRGGQKLTSVSLDKECSHINSTTVRVELSQSTQKQALLSGATVSLVQKSASTIHAVFAGHQLEYPFPHLVNVNSARTRIARKSAYIEIVASVWSPSNHGWDGTINRFPVMNPPSKAFSPFNIHHVTLDSLPVLDLSADKQTMTWLMLHSAHAFSAREKHVQNSPTYQHNPNDCDTFVSVKDTIHTLFTRRAGLHSQGAEPCKLFGLHDPSDGGYCYAIVFAVDLRLDLSGHTVVLDSFVVPLTERFITQPHLRSLFSSLKSFEMCTVITTSNEAKAWKMLLPAFVERCRQWRHLDSCEYSKAAIPLSFAVDESPICSCGEGKSVDALLAVKEWAGWAPYATRAAISPLFAVPYLERMGMPDNGPVGAPLPLASGVVSAGHAESCARCVGPGKPQLLTCSRCKRAKYCSTDCQRADWKQHKKQCR